MGIAIWVKVFFGKLFSRIRFLLSYRLSLQLVYLKNSTVFQLMNYQSFLSGFLGSERQFNETYSKPINQSRDPKSATKDQEAGALAMESLHRQVIVVIANF